MIEFATRRLSEELPGAASQLAVLFGDDVVAVPVPLRFPFNPNQPDPLWVTKRIAEALRKRGLVGAVSLLLERVKPIDKSATAIHRPSFQTHMDSMKAVGFQGLASERLLLVDDVITKGVTLYACATRLREAFPAAEVSAFSLLRTMGLVQDVERILEPCLGRICWDPARNEPHRIP